MARSTAGNNQTIGFMLGQSGPASVNPQMATRPITGVRPPTLPLG